MSGLSFFLRTPRFLCWVAILFGVATVATLATLVFGYGQPLGPSAS